jgi:hypothetical protein
VIPFLIAQNDALEKVSQGFRDYSKSQGGFALVLAVLLSFAIVAALLYAVVSNRDRMIGRRMFMKLARASKLARAEREFLIHVARRVLPDNPPAIFVRRTLFENAIAELTAEAGLAQAVRRKVYGR